MITTIAKNPPDQPRESQFLPTVRCSTCNNPVPLSNLGDHTCVAPPPIPSVPNRGIPPSFSTTDRDWAPVRTTSPAISVRSTASSNRLQSASSPPRQDSRLKIDTTRMPPSPTHSTFRSSPLARNADPVERKSTSSPKPGPSMRDIHHDQNLLSSPLRPRVDGSSNQNNNNNGASPQSTPSTPRPPLSLNMPAKESGPSRGRGPPLSSIPRQGQGFPSRPPGPVASQPQPAMNMNMNIGPPQANGDPFPRRPSVNNNNDGGPSVGYPRRPGPPGSMSSAPPPPRLMTGGLPNEGGAPSPRLATSGEAFIPPMERGINTSSGGEAGMAGVGRRGFAAAARAAMFVSSGPRPMGPQQQPYYNRKQMMPQNLDLNAAARSSETPPLSAGSGYSSPHSPGPTSPLPQSFYQQPSRILKAPSSGQQAPGALAAPSMQTNGIGDDSTPISPFFEKGKQLPGIPTDTKPTAISQSSSSTSASVGASSASRKRDIPADQHSSAESEYGLAYADSTDYEDEEDERGRSIISPRGAPLKASILRSISNNSKVQFGSVSERSRSNDSVRKARANAARSTLTSEAHSESHRLTNHSRDNSVSSSYSSNAESDYAHRERSNSSAIALALGLSQTPPSEYRKLGGPGMYNVGGRVARSGSGKKETEKDPKAPRMSIKKVSISAASTSSGLSMSFRERARDGGEEDNNALNLGTKAKTQRSNTVQGVVQVQSPDRKSVKLPVRAQSEREKPAGVGEGKGLGLPRKMKATKVKVCLKCSVMIENGRWVPTDSDGVLCEKCWKNMYLPKCRRCNLPIERQAVSSSDGQLKGKYHKECFNCHECHMSFPDKTFYVYDGKPLCAYHYHEANDSLCAAARCGQPIEGPCAVSHTGDRYHPEHMTCEYPGSECGETLEEYWEVEGRMLCERHAVYASRVENDDGKKGKKAMKRVTRFIDLAGGINPLANTRGDDKDGLR